MEAGLLTASGGLLDLDGRRTPLSRQAERFESPSAALREVHRRTGQWPYCEAELDGTYESRNRRMRNSIAGISFKGGIFNL
jgi:hypothetical protein